MTSMPRTIMPKTIDMHMHTTASDGMKSPAELLEIVRASGVSVFSVTDHDTFAGNVAVRELLQPDDAILITGIELSAGDLGEDLHMLAYFLHSDTIAADSPIAIAVTEFQRRRETRGALMVEKLVEQGLDITLESVLEIANGSPIGRPHIADALLRSGAIATYSEAFNVWIGYRKPGFVDKENISPNAAIDLVHECGGIVSLAHPGINKAEDELDRLIGLGLDSIEVLHPGNSSSQRKRYRKLAQKHGLAISGGSDYHGRNDHHSEVSQMQVPYEYFERLQERAERYR